MCAVAWPAAWEVINGGYAPNAFDEELLREKRGVAHSSALAYGGAEPPPHIGRQAEMK